MYGKLKKQVRTQEKCSDSSKREQVTAVIKSSEFGSLATDELHNGEKKSSYIIENGWKKNSFFYKKNNTF